MRPIKITRGPLTIGGMFFHSGSGGGPTPHDKPVPTPSPKPPSWWERFLAWLRKHK